MRYGQRQYQIILAVSAFLEPHPPTWRLLVISANAASRDLYWAELKARIPADMVGSIDEEAMELRRIDGPSLKVSVIEKSPTYDNSPTQAILDQAVDSVSGD